jgi:hypothetical protein
MASYCRCFWANISKRALFTESVVVVLSYMMATQFHVQVTAKDKLWIAFGKGKDFKWVSSYGVSLSIGPPALCLPLVHAFTSCDTQPNLDGCKDAILKVNIIYDVNTFGDKPFNYCFTKLCREYFCYTVLLGTFGW